MDAEAKSVGTMAPDSEEKPVHPTRKRSIEAEQKRYSSITEFCNYYGLRYTSVQYHLRRGKTGDEILAILQQRSVSRRYSKAPGRAVSVKIGDDIFPSISEAAMAYGVTPLQIESAMLDGTATPAFLNMAAADDPDRLAYHAKECVIAGVTYPSLTAAARAYGIPMVTIRSRMAREGITFEEALRRGHRERHRIAAEYTKWRKINLEPFKDDAEQMKLTNDLLSVLEQNNYHTRIFQDPDTKVFAIQIQESLDAVSRPLDIYILYDEFELSKDIEFVIPMVGKQKILSDSKQILLYQQISAANEQYIGSKVFLRDRIFSASWSIALTSRSIQVTSFMRTFYRFIGSTGGIWEELKWAEQETVSSE